MQSSSKSIYQGEKPMSIQVVGYDGIFPKTLRKLLDCHPVTGERTTLKKLAEFIGIRQQTVSLYKNGETQPTPETLVKIAEFFTVSVDYILTGVSSQNKSIDQELGLSEEAINMLKRAKEADEYDESLHLVYELNRLLSDRDFYEFLEDVSLKISHVKAVLNGSYDQSNMKNLNIEGYFIWDLQKYVEEFILKQLVKRGLAIEERTVKIHSSETDE